jgi:hypothetical protein
MRLPEGTQSGAYPASLAAIGGLRLYAANGRAITIRTIR